MKIKSRIAMVVALVASLSTQSALADWTKISGSATDIGSGGRKIWVTGTNKIQGGYGVFHLEGGSWKAIDGAAVAITADSSGKPWVVNNKNEIFSRDGTWHKLPGSARDIAAGGNNVWVIGTTPTAGGYQIFHWNGSSWDLIPGGAVRIAVDAAGSPWVINANDEIFHFVHGQWQQLPGRGKDIAISPDNTAWIIGTTPVAGGYEIHRWTGSTWNKIEGGAVRIAVDYRGNPWVVNNTGEIFGYQFP